MLSLEKNNREKRNTYRKKYEKKTREPEDECFRLACNLQSRLR